MQNANCPPKLANQVMALYPDRARSFSLAGDATFADLADYLDTPHIIDGWHGDMPTAISLTFAVNRQAGNILQAGI
jgi:hypothetical protein